MEGMIRSFCRFSMYVTTSSNMITVCYRMSKLLTTMWSNFIKYGNPTPRPVEKIKWLPSSEVKREYLVIGKETKMASSLSLLRRLSIWKAVLGED